MTNLPRQTLWIRLAGPVVFLSALCFYLVTLSRGPFPGDSARLIVEQAELDAFPALTYPLYGMFARAIVHIPVATLATRLNVLSALLGATAVWLLFALTAAIPRNRTFEERVARFHAPAVQTMSGLVAAVVFALSIPFWISSTRAHVAPLNMTILLSSVWFLLRYASTHRFLWLGLACFLYGLGVTDFATMLLIAPLFGGFAVFFLSRAGRLRPREISLLVLCGLAGLAPYAIEVLHYAHQSAVEWRKFSGAGQILYQLLYAQYYLLLHGLPKLGWLTVAVVSVVPWLAVIGFRVNPAGERSSGAWFGSYVLNFFLLGLAGLVLTNAVVSPWRVSGMRPLLVTPYALIAMWLGYVVGYWYVIVVRSPRHNLAVTVTPAKRAAGAALFALIIVALGFVGLGNRPMADGRLARPVQQVAQLMASHLAGREILISASPLDDLLLLAAREQGHPIRVINHDHARASSYLNYVASLFPGNDRLQGLAHVGLTPVITEWLQTDPSARDRLAVFSSPDLWYAGGMEPVSACSFFRGPRVGAPEDLAALLAEHQKFWAQARLLLTSPQPRGSPMDGWLQYLSRHLAKIANNLGVLLEDRRRPDLAFEAYSQARMVNPRNLSSLLNIYALCQREKRPETAKLEEELKKLPAHLGIQYWALAYHDGYVRSPEAYASRGWAWAMSGKPNLALGDLQNAVQMGSNTASLRVSMANLLFEERPAESEKMLIEVLRERPNDRKALLGLAHAAMRKGDFDSAIQYLGRLRELGANEVSISIEESIVDSLAGRTAEAETRLQAVLKKNPGNQRALTFLALIAAEKSDEKLVENCLRQLKMGRQTPPPVLLAVAHLALARRDWMNARKHFAHYLQLRPTDTAALEQILVLDRLVGDREAAERHVEGLLSLDPSNTLANYILGHLQASRGDLALAEASLRVSLAGRRIPDALNELAWLLMLRGQLEEAEKLARECVTQVPAHPEGWDTLGVILLRRGDLVEAEKALQKALQVTPEDVDVILHTAQLLEKKGQFEASLKLADHLLAKPTQLDKAAYDELRELVKRLRTHV